MAAADENRSKEQIDAILTRNMGENAIFWQFAVKSGSR
jgi:hypothetical protein